MKKLIALSLVLSAAIIACSQTKSKPTPPPLPKTPAEVCADVMDHVCAKSIKCDPEVTTADCAAFSEDICGTTTSIRDQKALYDVCVPWIDTAACDTMAATFPDECRGQFQ